MKNGILKNSQHSFLNEKSCDTSLRVSEDVSRYVDKGDEVDAISFYFSKGIGPSSKVQKNEAGRSRRSSLD